MAKDLTFKSYESELLLSTNHYSKQMGCLESKAIDSDTLDADLVDAWLTPIGFNAVSEAKDEK